MGLQKDFKRIISFSKEIWYKNVINNKLNHTSESKFANVVHIFKTKNLASDLYRRALKTDPAK